MTGRALVPLALGALAVAALSACAVPRPQAAARPPAATQQPSPTHQPGTLAGRAGVPPTGATSPSPSPASPLQRAQADAAAILASFAVPAGARWLAAAPGVEDGLLSQPAQEPATPDLVDNVSWWVVPGAPQPVLAWEKAHLSDRFSSSGTATGTGPGATFWSDEFSLPAIPAVLDSRELIVTAVSDGDRTAIRADAQVTWQPARPAGERVPAAVKAVTISMDIGTNQGGRKPPIPVTITDQARVHALLALVNDLPPFPPGEYSCPADFGATLTLTFLAAPGTPALAVATADLAGCDGVSLTIGGRPQPALAGPGTGTGPLILKAAGLPWKIPSE